VFTGVTEITAQRFWELSDAAEFAARNECFEHLDLVGGFVAGFIMVANTARRGRTQ
jgi:hypothetical protein